MDELELAQRLTELNPAPPVLLLSAASAIPEGRLPSAFLAKSFAAHDLIDVVHQLLGATDNTPPDDARSG